MQGARWRERMGPVGEFEFEGRAGKASDDRARCAASGRLG